MATGNAGARIMRDLDSELRNTLARVSADLDRVEILAGALAGFAHSVPDYEPKFHHLSHVSLRKHELGR